MRWIAASLLVVDALYALVTRQWTPVVIVVAVVVAAVAMRGRAVLPLGLGASRLLSAVAATAGAVVGWLSPVLPGLEILRKPWPSLALGALCAGVTRLFLAAGPREAPALALLPGLAALAAAGETSVGYPYGVAVVAWLACALQALRVGDVGRPAWSAVRRRDRLVGVAVVGVALGFAAIAAVALPPLSMWTERRLLRALGGAETGFSDRMWLGSLDGMLDSDEVVMRLEGPRTDYLRGAVYNHYEIGRWGRTRPPRSHPAALPAEAPGESGERVRITVVSGARDRYFLPLGAHAVATSGPPVAVDGYGVVRVADGVASEISFVPGGTGDFAIDAPTEDDLLLPPPLRATLVRLAGEWSAGADTPQAKVHAIAAHLREQFTYSRTFQRREADPLLDFLLDDHQGHCEYFASGTALLARAAGVPARVAVGYRVAEENALGDYYMVREKNAHAWAEVYLEGRGFVTVDATPMGGLDQNAPHQAGLVRALVDLLGAWWARAVTRLTLWDLVRASVAVLVAGLLVRWLGAWRGRARGAAAGQWRAEKPPPALVALFEALARRGLVRGEDEPIERFAGRVAETEGAGEAVTLLERWAAFRYGGIGDEGALFADLARGVERLRAGR